LESVYTGNRIVGSNPTPSATTLFAYLRGRPASPPGSTSFSGRVVSSRAGVMPSFAKAASAIELVAEPSSREIHIVAALDRLPHRIPRSERAAASRAAERCCHHFVDVSTIG